MIKIPDTNRNYRAVSILLAYSLFGGMSAHGVIGMLVEHGTSPNATDFDLSISTTDLINTGSPSLASVSSTPLVGVARLNDGTPGSCGITDVYYPGSPYPATIDFHLDLSVNTLGYQLSSLATITGLGSAATHDPEWVDRYHEWSHQVYTVSYSLIGDAGFTEFVSVSEAAALGEDATKVTLIGLSSEVPSGVDAVRFTWFDPVPLVATSPLPGRTITMIREIDVFGSPVPVPEPSSLALLGLASMMVLRRRRRAGS